MPGPAEQHGAVRLSVLVMSYMHERYLARALDSVLRQDVSVRHEVLVGDDGSTDGSRAIIADYARRHPDLIRPLLPDSNLGSAGKRLYHELLSSARGELVAHLDGDDYWTAPEKLQRQVAHMDAHPECVVCFHNVLWLHEDGSRPPVPYNSPSQATRVGVEELIGSNPVAACSAVFRREAISPLPDWFFEQPWGDWQLCLRAALRGELHYLPDVMAVHVTHPGGMFSQLSLTEALRTITTIQEAMPAILPPSLDRRRRQALGQTWFQRAHEHTRLGERAEARRCLRESLRVWPFDPRRLRRPGGGERRRLALALRLLGAGAVRAPWKAVQRARRPEGGSPGA